MTTDTDAPNPAAGGSYVRNADGSLTQVEGTKPATEPDSTSAQTGGNAGAETPADSSSAGA